MRLSNLLTPLTLLPTVLASGQTITDALTTINTGTQSLLSKVESWKGDLLSTIPIIIDSVELLKGINNATEVTEASNVLEPLEALGVAVAVNTLSGGVNQTITALLAQKPKFDRLHLSPVILLNLELEKSATDKFGAALVDKLPEELKGAAAQLQATIDGYFDTGIEAYKLF